MKGVKDIQNIKGVKTLVRVDFNVPVVNGKVVDDFRIRKIMPTLTYLREHGAKSILMSHIENNVESNPGAPAVPSLEPVALYLTTVGIDCVFIKNYRNAMAAIEALPEGGFILLENLRINEGEKKNDTAFARELASLGDVYINEAFSVSHRAHASVVAITNFLPSYAGFLFEQEVSHLRSAFDPKRPFLFLLGGAKFETKLPLIEKFMTLADKVFVGGALANNFFKEKGYALGTSLVSPDDFNLKRFFNNPKLLLPIDAVVLNALGEASVKKLDVAGTIDSGDSIMDAGPQTVEMLRTYIEGKSDLGVPAQIIWNGPVGAYERGYKQPTEDLARMIASVTSTSDTIVGGGDTLATIGELNLEDSFSFVSSGGGAMLDFLANETLPGIDALNKSTL